MIGTGRNRTAALTTTIVSLFLVGGVASLAQRSKGPAKVPPPSIPKVIKLSTRAKAGPVTFNHVKHNGGDYTAAGPVLCIQCHHTAQPAAELASVPPFRTVWPTDRDTTLTAELFAADPKKAGVAACRDCHVRTGQKPKLVDSMPVIEDPETGMKTFIDNENAFHTACDVCHFEIGFRTSKTKAPVATNCASCHRPQTRKRSRQLRRSH